MKKSSTITEASILERVVEPTAGNFPPETARAVLALRFDAATNRKIRALLRLNNAGTIAAAERLDLEKYLRVGQLLDLLHAKARVSLQEAHSS